MISKLRFLLADAAENWRLGVAVATTVSAILVIGLHMRAPYLADAKVEIGGITYGYDVNGAPGGYMPLEEPTGVENFFIKHVFVNSSFDAGNHCSAQAIYSPDGQRLKLSCRGKSENQVRELILSTLKPLLDRHAKRYALAEKYYGERLNLIEREIHERERIVGLLRKLPATALSETKIIEQQMMIERLRQSLEFERLLGSRVKPTWFDEAKISVVHRQPNITVWAVVLLLSLGSGLITAAFKAKLKHIEI